MKIKIPHLIFFRLIIPQRIVICPYGLHLLVIYSIVFHVHPFILLAISQEQHRIYWEDRLRVIHPEVFKIAPFLQHGHSMGKTFLTHFYFFYQRAIVW